MLNGNLQTKWVGLFSIEELAWSGQLLKSINIGIFLFQYNSKQIFTVSCDIVKFSSIFQILIGPVTKNTVCRHCRSVFIVDFEHYIYFPPRASNMLKIDDKDSSSSSMLIVRTSQWRLCCRFAG